MDVPVSVPAPLLGPGEPGSRLAAIHAMDGTHVRHGQPLVTHEADSSLLRVDAKAPGHAAGRAPAWEIHCDRATGNAGWPPSGTGNPRRRKEWQASPHCPMGCA